MRIRFVLVGVGVLFIVMALAAACGGGGDEASIRTEKGLAVAALAAGAQAGEEVDGGGDEASIAIGAPSDDTAVGFESRGAIAPDIAPFPFPSLQDSQTGITVQGYGSASVDADSAVLALYISSGMIEEFLPLSEPAPPGEFESGSDGSAPGLRDAPPPPIEITEADLQPIVDAIAAQGVSRDDIEVTVDPSYGDPYFGGSATIRVTVRNVDALDGIVDAAGNAASDLDDIALGGTSISYTVADCAALERAAMEAAVDDARERGISFAGVLGVGLGPVVGASSFSSSLFGGAPCDADFGGPYPLGGVAFAENQSAEVQLVATVTVTFAIQ